MIWGGRCVLSSMSTPALRSIASVKLRKHWSGFKAKWRAIAVDASNRNFVDELVSNEVLSDPDGASGLILNLECTTLDSVSQPCGSVLRTNVEAAILEGLVVISSARPVQCALTLL